MRPFSGAGYQKNPLEVVELVAVRGDRGRLVRWVRFGGAVLVWRAHG